MMNLQTIDSMQPTALSPPSAEQRTAPRARWLTRLIMLPLLGALLLPATAVGAAAGAEAESAADADYDQAELEAQLEAAREALDQAARQLAELNMKKFKVEIDGPKADRPMLGVLIEEKNSGDGVTLVGVTPKGGAAAAGLKAGDRLVAVNGHRLDGGDNSQYAMHDAMAEVKAGDTVSVEFVRDGGVLVADLKTTARSEFAAQMIEDIDIDIDLSALSSLEDLQQLKGLEKLEALGSLEGMVKIDARPGLKLEDVAGDLADYFGIEQGVVVMATPEDSELRAGDVLLTLDGAQVESAWQALTTLKHADVPVTAEVLRRKQRLSVQVDDVIAVGARVIKIKKPAHEQGAAEKPAP